jgi:hypothetical protein
MKDVLIIKPNVMLKQNNLACLHRAIVDQLKTGVVLLPAYLDAELVNVPDDVEVIIEASENNEYGLENSKETT